MRRREFVALIGATAVAWPLGAHAQEPGKRPTIGVLGADAPSWTAWTAAFAERLKQLGWIEGRTVAIEYRWSEGRPERVAEVAGEFVRHKVDIIVTYGGAVAAFKQATAGIHRSCLQSRSIRSALASSTAFRIQAATLRECPSSKPKVAGKRLELLREIIPGLGKLAILFDATYPASAREADNVQTSARKFGLAVMPRGRAEELPISRRLLMPSRVRLDAVYLVEDAL